MERIRNAKTIFTGLIYFCFYYFCIIRTAPYIRAVPLLLVKKVTDNRDFKNAF